MWGGPLCRRPGLCPPKRVNVSEDAVGGKQPEVPGPRTPLYPRAHRTRDTIDAHSRSAAGVSLFTSTRSDTTTNRVWVTTIRSPVGGTTPPTPAPSGRAVRCRHPDSQVAGSPSARRGRSPLRRGSGRQHPTNRVRTVNQHNPKAYKPIWGPKRPAHDPNTPRPPVCATPTYAPHVF